MTSPFENLATMPFEEFKKQLDDHPNVNEVTASGMSLLDSLLESAVRGTRADIVRLLLERGASVNLEGAGRLRATVLNDAACAGATEVISVLLDHGADINHQNGDNRTPLLQAAIYGRAEAAELLVKRGASLEGDLGYEPFNNAVFYRYPAIAEMLIVNGIDVNLRGSKRKAPFLHLVVGKGYASLAKQLIEKGAQVNAKATGGKTALHVAMAKGNLELVKLLMESGADTSAVLTTGLDKGQSILELAKKANNKNVTNLVTSYGTEAFHQIPIGKKEWQFVNVRQPFKSPTSTWDVHVEGQVKELLRKATLEEAEVEAPELELCDVVDAGVNKTLYQLYAYDNGSGALFANGKATLAAGVVQYNLEFAKRMKKSVEAELREGLEMAKKSAGNKFATDILFEAEDEG